jgi:hypothetical protein
MDKSENMVIEEEMKSIDDLVAMDEFKLETTVFEYKTPLKLMYI